MRLNLREDVVNKYFKWELRLWHTYWTNEKDNSKLSLEPFGKHVILKLSQLFLIYYHYTLNLDRRLVPLLGSAYGLAVNRSKRVDEKKFLRRENNIFASDDLTTQRGNLELLTYLYTGCPRSI